MESPSDTDNGRQCLALAAQARAAGDERECHTQLQAAMALDPEFPFALLPSAAASPPSTAGARCLIVHSDPRVTKDIAETLAAAGYEAETACDANAALAIIAARAVDAVVVAPDAAATVIDAARARQPFAAAIAMVCMVRGELDRDPAMASTVDERVDRPATRSRWVESVHAAIWRRRHAPRPPSLPAAAGLARAHTHAALVVAAGFVAMAFAAGAVRELTPVSANAPVWLERAAAGAPWSVTYRSPAELMETVLSEPMRDFADSDFVTFEIRLRSTSLRQVSEVAASLRLIVGDRQSTPHQVWVATPSAAAAPAQLVFAAFSRDAVGDAERMRLQAKLGDDDLTAYLERFAARSEP